MKTKTKTYYLLALFVVISLMGFEQKTGTVAETPTTIFLVRHAEQEKTNMQEDPPLLEAGKERATVLKHVLSKLKLAAAYTTEFERGKATALPTSQANNIEITPYKIEDDKVKFIQSVKENYKGKNASVTHLNYGKITAPDK